MGFSPLFGADLHQGVADLTRFVGFTDQFGAKPKRGRQVALPAQGGSQVEPREEGREVGEERAALQTGEANA